VYALVFVLPLTTGGGSISNCLFCKSRPFAVLHFPFFYWCKYMSYFLVCDLRRGFCISYSPVSRRVRVHPLPIFKFSTFLLAEVYVLVFFVSFAATVFYFIFPSFPFSGRKPITVFSFLFSILLLGELYVLVFIFRFRRGFPVFYFSFGDRVCLSFCFATWPRGFLFSISQFSAF